MAIVGRCEKCGRDFVTMPPDGKDHFGVKEHGTSQYRICGGHVRPVDAAARPTPAAEGG